MLRAYGTKVYALLGDAAAETDLGRHFGNGLYEKEVRYLMAQEWARCADDVIWRRSKLGIGMNNNQVSELDIYMKAQNEDFSRNASA